MLRPRTYYLPWITRPGLDCALVLSNVEARFKPELSAGPILVTVVQYDARGKAARQYEVTLVDSTDTVEMPLTPAAGGCGFATVRGEGLHSDLYVTLSDGHDYTATHGREEFIEEYPGLIRRLLSTAGAVMSVLGRTLPIFTRNQFVYLGPESRSHVLLMNLSKRDESHPGRGQHREAPYRLAPAPAAADGVASARRRLPRPPALIQHQGLAAQARGQCLVQPVHGGRGVEGPRGSLSLMHVK